MTWLRAAAGVAFGFMVVLGAVPWGCDAHSSPLPMFFAVLALVGSPLAFVAWGRPRSRRVPLLAVGLLLFACLADVYAMAVGVNPRQVELIGFVIGSHWVLFGTWALSAFLWQCLVVVLVFRWIFCDVLRPRARVGADPDSREI